jgi:hypothetical protein
MKNLENLPNAGDITTYSVAEYYGIGLLNTPDSFHDSPLTTTWMGDAQRCDQDHHAKNFLMSIVKYFEDQEVNPFKGSIPSERVRYYARKHLTDQFIRVVGDSSKKWDEYIRIIQMFSVDLPPVIAASGFTW